MAFIRFGILAFVVLSVIYAALAAWSRWTRRGKLETLWIEHGRPGDRESFIREGLAEYDRSARKKLILGVYIVPMALVALIVYLVNYA